jgi:predicted N-acyltransferase
MPKVIEVANGIQSVDAERWDALVGDMPLLQHAFLVALENAGSVGGETGWQACPMLLKDGDDLLGAIPLYIKHHSYGEYVFDWAWADAFERNGFSYYPKLLVAIPFTPITSERVLAKSLDDRLLMLRALEQVMHQQSFSSIHINFPDASSAETLKQAGWLQRHGVQFRWENQAFDTFDDFLNTLTRDKRKKIRQERKKIEAADVVCRTIKGPDITAEEWQFFYQCYTNTYREHRSTPYLTASFFLEIGQTMSENIVLFVAYCDGAPIASAFNIYHASTLYGRYWGALKYVPNLHFELCYYQAQAFCIAEGIQYFEGGAQGEHKLARGFVARPTCSFHKISHPEFERAITSFIENESKNINMYSNELEQRSPYKIS